MHILPKATVRWLASKSPPTAKERREGGIPAMLGIDQDHVFVSRMAMLFKYCLVL